MENEQLKGNGSFSDLFKFLEYNKVYRRYPINEREAEIMTTSLFSVVKDNKSLYYRIEKGITCLRDFRFNDDKIVIYKAVCRLFIEHFKSANIKQFERDYIMSFIDDKIYSTRTKSRICKKIIEILISHDIISDKMEISDDIKKRLGKIPNFRIDKTAKQTRLFELYSDDKNSYLLLMKKNGFTDVNYYKFYCDSDGIPRRRKVGTSKLNGFPVDKNGDSVEDFDLSVLKQTIPRHKQSVKCFQSKSLSFEKRLYSVAGYRVLI